MPLLGIAIVRDRMLLVIDNAWCRVRIRDWMLLLLEIEQGRQARSGSTLALPLADWRSSLGGPRINLRAGVTSFGCVSPFDPLSRSTSNYSGCLFKCM
jgi:hypothetical protein